MKRTVKPATSNRRNGASDPFRFGWRWVGKQLANGKEQSVRMPLTLDDVLHPQEGDHIPENTQQEKDRRYLACVFDVRLADHTTAVVLSDCIVIWRGRGGLQHSPDVIVFFGVRNRRRVWKSFRVLRERARAIVAVEIVSPDDEKPQARENDVVHKLREYHAMGVPLYIIVDQEREDGPRQIIGYRHTPARYVPLTADAQGRILLKPLGILLGLKDNRVVAYDGTTDQELGDYTKVSQDLEAEVKARKKAEAKLQKEIQARQAAEAQLQQLQAELRRRNGPPRKNNCHA